MGKILKELHQNQDKTRHNGPRTKPGLKPFILTTAVPEHFNENRFKAEPNQVYDIFGKTLGKNYNFCPFIKLISQTSVDLSVFNSPTRFSRLDRCLVINAVVKNVAKTGGIASDGCAPHTGTWPCNEKCCYSPFLSDYTHI